MYHGKQELGIYPKQSYWRGTRRTTRFRDYETPMLRRDWGKRYPPSTRSNYIQEGISDERIKKIVAESALGSDASDGCSELLREGEDSDRRFWEDEGGELTEADLDSPSEDGSGREETSKTDEEVLGGERDIENKRSEPRVIQGSNDNSDNADNRQL